MLEPTPAHPVPRRMDFPFDEGIPRHWFGGEVLATHLANGLNLLFPAGERFFVRSVKRYLDRFPDEADRARIRGFFGQEGHHAREHQRFFAILEGQGYDIHRFLRVYEKVAYRWLEPLLPPALRLATTAAAEHFTAAFAEQALDAPFLDRAHPVLQDLLRWHAAEEIEHKSVAYDVLREVAPSYPLRIAGLLVATLTLVGFWMLAVWVLLRQDPDASLRRLWQEARAARRRGHVANGLLRRAIVQYLRPGFHPAQTGNDHLAQAYLDGIGRAEG